MSLEPGFVEETSSPPQLSQLELSISSLIAGLNRDIPVSRTVLWPAFNRWTMRLMGNAFIDEVPALSMPPKQHLRRSLLIAEAAAGLVQGYRRENGMIDPGTIGLSFETTYKAPRNPVASMRIIAQAGGIDAVFQTYTDESMGPQKRYRADIKGAHEVRPHVETEARLISRDEANMIQGMISIRADNIALLPYAAEISG